MNGHLDTGYLTQIRRYIVVPNWLTKWSHVMIVILSMGSLLLVCLLIFYFNDRRITMWDFSKTHTLADIGFTQPLSSIRWISSSYFGPEWWTGEFPEHNLNLVVRLPADTAFHFRNAGVGLYGHVRTIGGVTIGSGPYSYAAGEQKLKKWFAYWKFSAKERLRLKSFLHHVRIFVKQGKYPEIDFYANAPGGILATASMFVPVMARMGECNISVSIIWFNTPDASADMTKAGEPKWSP